MNEKIEKRFREIRRFGMYPTLAPAPSGAVTFDKMIVVYLDEAQKRLYQVFFYHTETDQTYRMA